MSSSASSDQINEAAIDSSARELAQSYSRARLRYLRDRAEFFPIRRRDTGCLPAWHRPAIALANVRLLAWRLQMDSYINSATDGRIVVLDVATRHGWVG